MTTTVPVAYVPACTNGYTIVDYSSESAASYDPLSGQYYTVTIKSNTIAIIASIVVGLVCWLGWLLWLCIPKLRGFRWPKKSRYQVLEEQGDESLRKDTEYWNIGSAGFPWMKAILVVMLLGVLGCDLWAMVEGIRSIQALFSGFLVITKDLAYDGAAVFDQASVVLNETSQLLGGLGTFFTEFDSAAGTSLSSRTQEPLTKATFFVNQTFMGVTKIEDKLTEVMQTVKDQWSNIQNTTSGTILNTVLIVCFAIIAMIIFFALVAVFMSKLRMLAWVNLLLLTIATVAMVVGTVAFHTGYKISRDTCLYVESYATKTAVNALGVPGTSQTVESVAQYITSTAYTSQGLALQEALRARQLSEDFTVAVGGFSGAAPVVYATADVTVGRNVSLPDLAEVTESILPAHMLDVYYNISGLLGGLVEHGLPAAEMKNSVVGEIVTTTLEQVVQSPLGEAVSAAWQSEDTMDGVTMKMAVESALEKVPPELKDAANTTVSFLVGLDVSPGDLDELKELDFASLLLLMKMAGGVLQMPQVTDRLAGLLPEGLDEGEGDLDAFSQALAKLWSCLDQLWYDVLPALLELLGAVGMMAARAYPNSKSFVCCSLGNSLNRLYIAWTVTGIVTTATCILIIIYVVRGTRFLKELQG